MTASGRIISFWVFAFEVENHSGCSVDSGVFILVQYINHSNCCSPHLAKNTHRAGRRVTNNFVFQIYTTGDDSIRQMKKEN